MARVSEAVDYAMQYSRGQSKDLIKRFVRMYVNDMTIEMGVLGEHSIRTFFNFGIEKGLAPYFDLRIA